MGHITKETIHATLPAMLPNGQTFEFKATIKKQSAFYKVDAVTTLIDMHNYHKALAITCKSSSDIMVLADFLEGTNNINDVIMRSLAESADYHGISLPGFKRLLDRAVATDLLYKLGTGHYFVNPFLYMGKAAIGEANYKQQELVQARWREITGLLSQSDIDNLTELSKFLGQEVILPGTEFNLSVAYYYQKHHTITSKQTTAYKKRGTIPANWSIHNEEQIKDAKTRD